MRARQILRIAMVAIALSVLALVVLNWGGRAEEPPEGPPVANSGRDDDVVSRTAELRYTAIENGVHRYYLEAGQRLGFRDNRSEFGGGVNLTIYGKAQEEGEQPESTFITGQWMDLRERADAPEDNKFEEVRLRSDVLAILPGGSRLTTDEISYSDELVRTNVGVVLRLAGLVVEARNFRYDPETGIVEVWGKHPMPLYSSESPGLGLAGDTDLPESDRLELIGSAGRLLYNVESSEIRLEGGPQPRVEIGGEAAVTGAELGLALSEGNERLEGVEARGEASADWLGETAPGLYRLTAITLRVELDDSGNPRVVKTVGGSFDTNRFFLGDAGSLRAGSMEFRIGEAGTGAIVATQGTRYVTDMPGIEMLRAAALRLALGSEGLDTALASGDVRVDLRSEDEEPMVASGQEALLEWRDGALSSSEWNEGIRYQHGGRSLEAAEGRYDSENDEWVLRGEPRLSEEQLDVTAEEIVLEASGAARMVGNVAATLRGEIIDTLGPVFGSTPELSARADSLEVTSDGRLRFRESARIWEGDQLLAAGLVVIHTAAEELQASDEVLVRLVAPEDDEGAEAGEGPGFAQFTGDRLLIAGSPPEMILAGNATLVADPRLITGDRIMVQFVEEGGWRSFEVNGNVTMEDPGGRARGERLVYAESGLVTVFAGVGGTASFSNQQGIDITDPEGLRLVWGEGNLSITAMQKGTTQTVRSGSQR